MTAMLKVKNWENFQHYKQRNPPWIRLHFALLSSEDWVTWDNESRVLAVACLLIASRHDGFVPENPAYLKRVAYLKRTPDLTSLISCGFLEKPQADASTLQALASTLQANARPEERQRREESLSETSSDEKPAARKKRINYPPDFEAVWLEYPTDPNMSKADAFKAYSKLDAADKDALAASMKPYRAYCRANPDYRPKHMDGFIKSRRFDGFQSQQTSPAEETALWPKRLRLARERRVWASVKWGPQPGSVGCRVPTELLQPGDGDGWGEWQEAA